MSTQFPGQERKEPILTYRFAEYSSITPVRADMNYQHVYDNLIAKYGTWEKPKGVYVERHRKFPGYLGGKYVRGNAFYVPARVHYLAHLLWAKITNHNGAWGAVKCLQGGLSCKSSKLYQKVRIIHAAHLSEILRGENNPMYGVKGSSHPRFGIKHTEESRVKMREANQGEKHPWIGVKGEAHPAFGYKHTDEARETMSKKGKGRPKSEITRKKISESSKGKPKSEEHRRKLSIAKLNSTKLKKEKGNE